MVSIFNDYALALITADQNRKRRLEAIASERQQKVLEAVATLALLDLSAGPANPTLQDSRSFTPRAELVSRKEFAHLCHIKNSRTEPPEKRLLAKVLLLLNQRRMTKKITEKLHVSEYYVTTVKRILIKDGAHEALQIKLSPDAEKPVPKSHLQNAPRFLSQDRINGEELVKRCDFSAEIKVTQCNGNVLRTTPEANPAQLKPIIANRYLRIKRQ